MPSSRRSSQNGLPNRYVLPGVYLAKAHLQHVLTAFAVPDARQRRPHAQTRRRLTDWIVDESDSLTSDGGGEYAPSDEDGAATDWMEYQPPAENWIDFEF